MWFRKKNVTQKIARAYNPAIAFELVEEEKSIRVHVFWEPHTPFNTELFINGINLLNRGKLYNVIKNAVVKQGESSGDMELANHINSKIDNPESVIDERPVIPASMVSRYHFSQNHNLDEE